MNEIIPVENYTGTRPYGVEVNGWLLVDKAGRPRRYKDSISAAIAGAKHVDKIRRELKANV